MVATPTDNYIYVLLPPLLRHFDSTQQREGNNRLHDARRPSLYLRPMGDDYSTPAGYHIQGVQHIWRRRLLLERIDYDPVWQRAGVHGLHAGR